MQHAMTRPALIIPPPPFHPPIPSTPLLPYLPRRLALALRSWGQLDAELVALHGCVGCAHGHGRQQNVIWQRHSCMQGTLSVQKAGCPLHKGTHAAATMLAKATSSAAALRVWPRR